MYKYNILSKYRTEIMGVAILWVMFFHSSINIDNFILKILKTIGYGGVDIFLMLSGFGLYYAYKKNNDMRMFYKRRFLRLLPTYLPVVIVYCGLYYITGRIGLKTLIMNITTLSFYFNTDFRFDWYIPATIILYLISPIILKMFFKSEKINQKYSIIGLCIFIGIFLSMLIINSQVSYLLIFTSRIPIFFIGRIIAYWSDINKDINKVHFLLGTLLFIIGFITLMIFIKYFSNYLWEYGLWWWPFLIITLPLCIFICVCMDFVVSKGITELKFIKFCGNHSLELYLFHERVLNLLEFKFINLDKVIINVICVIITFIMAFIWKKIITYICKLNINRKLHRANTV